MREIQVERFAQPGQVLLGCRQLRGHLPRWYWHEKEFKAVGQISQIASKQGIPAATLAIGWVLNQPAVTSVILGATRVEQLTDMLAALDVFLVGRLRTELDETSIEFRKGDAERWERSKSS